MKFNWGTGIVIAFALFMSFILFFVFKVQSDSKYDNELVVEDYYKQERILQDKLNREENAVSLHHQLTINSTQKGIEIEFPEDFDAAKIKGKVFLYRPSNQRLDIEQPITISASHLLIPKSDLVDGRWNITVDWEYQGIGYLNSKEITVY
ncbi:FixH family protein [Flavobacterium beibuense]|uniref:Cytochrome cbb3 oxidase maturation protein CcoH n=1 Tax=Flavobacterium beibuense TaxID=657326 RepID=A0A444WAY1_9FLAO|nr:FixH family protein [Flavobacterium beibuense]RYJ42981.1 Cytochrome cbb3 oxidase maturation protein CcoH [Flavobacterium beibuense]